MKTMNEILSDIYTTKKYYTIAVDFDGTCVTNEFPKVGKDIGAIPILKQLVENGHRIVIYTVRDGDYLKDAIKWYEDNDIKYYAVNENPDQNFTKSRKFYVDFYIDDLAIGTPLKTSPISIKPFVDWKEIKKILIEKEIL